MPPLVRVLAYYRPAYAIRQRRIKGGSRPSVTDVASERSPSPPTLAGASIQGRRGFRRALRAHPREGARKGRPSSIRSEVTMRPRRMHVGRAPTILKPEAAPEKVKELKGALEKK